MMDGHRCKACGKFWSSQATGRVSVLGEKKAGTWVKAHYTERFRYINSLCPDCIGRTPVMAVEDLTGPTWAGLNPGELPGEQRVG